MLDWWGPLIHEYYSSTEFNGMTTITPEDWLAHRGSVRRATFGTFHITAEDGETELDPRQGASSISATAIVSNTTTIR